jgi:F-type H+-transporting ATPase subunit delta
MLSGSVARRYARAVLLIGQQHNNYDSLASEIDRLAATYEKSADLRAMIENPAFTVAQRQAVLDELSGRLMLSKTVHHLISLLLDRGRLSQLPGIARNLRVLVDEQAGRVRARVTSARPLDPATESRISLAVGKATGRAVLLEKRIDPALLGGIVTQVGDIVYDGSLATELQQLRDRWMKN